MTSRSRIRPMRSLWCALLVACGLLVFGPRASMAQEVSIATPDSGRARINGFAGLDWGVGRGSIQSRWGVPDTVRAVPSLDSEALIYADRSVLGEDGSMGFLVHPDSGLVRGMYLLAYGRRNDCRRLYGKFRDAITRTLGGLEGEETRASTAEDLDFCTAFQLGRARARTVWRDTTRGARAWIRLDRQAGALRVSFESPAFRALRSRARRRSGERWLGGRKVGADSADRRRDSLSIPTDSVEAATDTIPAPDPLQPAKDRHGR